MLVGGGCMKCVRSLRSTLVSVYWGAPWVCHETMWGDEARVRVSGKREGKGG